MKGSQSFWSWALLCFLALLLDIAGPALGSVHPVTMKLMNRTYVPGDFRRRKLQTEPLTNQQTSYYSSTTFTLGGQKVDFLLDTGSSDIWVLQQGSNANLFTSSGSACCADKCCDNSCAAPYADKSSCTFRIVYGSGNASGVIGQTSVTVGNFAINPIQAGLASSTPSDLSSIMGLAFSGVSVFTTPLVVDTVKLFTFQFNANAQASSGNNLLLGNDANVALPSTLSWHSLPIAKDSGLGTYGHWSVTMTSVTAGNSTVLGSTQKALADTGTSLLAVPQDQLKSLLNALGVTANCRFASNQGLYTCGSITNLKNLVITIATTTGTTAFTLTPEAYTTSFGAGEFSVLLDSSGSATLWILGLTFLRAFPYVKFDASSSVPTVQIACTASCTTTTGLVDISSTVQGSNDPVWKKVVTIGGIVIGGLVVLSVLFYAVRRAINRRRRQARLARQAQQQEHVYHEMGTPLYTTQHVQPHNDVVYAERV